MRRRRIVGPDAVSWSPEQSTLLLRIREAQALGAFNLLSAKLGTLRGLATEFESADGYKRLWLTAEGYQRFIFLLSQEARAYFESRGAEAKFVFELKTLGGKLLFTPDGFLTQEGIELYQRIRRKLPAFWRYPGGGVTGNVRPPPELLRPAATAPPAHAPQANPESAQDRGASAPPAGPDAAFKPAWEAPPAGAPEEGPQSPEAHALERVAALIRSGYVEITQEEVQAIIQAAKVPAAQLEKETSLQVVRTGQKVFFLLSPSDPLMSFVQQRRAAPSAGGGQRRPGDGVPLDAAAQPAGTVPLPQAPPAEGAPQGGAPPLAPK